MDGGSRQKTNKQIENKKRGSVQTGTQIKLLEQLTHSYDIGGKALHRISCTEEILGKKYMQGVGVGGGGGARTSAPLHNICDRKRPQQITRTPHVNERGWGRAEVTSCPRRRTGAGRLDISVKCKDAAATG